MSRKNVMPSKVVIDAVSMAADITSTPTDVRGLDGITYRITWSGASPVGELRLQARQEPDNLDGVQSTDWFDVDLGSTMTVDNTETEHTLKILSIEYPQIRLKYYRTSGTGTMSAKVSMKQLGG